MFLENCLPEVMLVGAEGTYMSLCIGKVDTLQSFEIMFLENCLPDVMFAG